MILWRGDPSGPLYTFLDSFSLFHMLLLSSHLQNTHPHSTLSPFLRRGLPFTNKIFIEKNPYKIYMYVLVHPYVTTSIYIDIKKRYTYLSILFSRKKWGVFTTNQIIVKVMNIYVGLFHIFLVSRRKWKIHNNNNSNRNNNNLIEGVHVCMCVV